MTQWHFALLADLRTEIQRGSFLAGDVEAQAQTDVQQ